MLSFRKNNPSSGWAALLLGCVALTGCKEKNTYAPPPAPKVTYSKPFVHDVPLYMEQNGQTEAVQRADVRARVEGFLREIKFSPGDAVRGEGLEASDASLRDMGPAASNETNNNDPVTAVPPDDTKASPTSDSRAPASAATVLFVIEQDRYKADVESAEAKLAAAKAALIQGDAAIEATKATLERDQKEFERQKNLLAENATAKSKVEQAEATFNATQQQLEAANAQKAVFEADILKAKADLANAELNLHYTEVVAPIDGVVSKTDVKIGNLVEPGTLLTTVVGQNQMYANFNINEFDMLKIRKAAKEQGLARDRLAYKGFRVELRTQVDEGFPYVGQLDYIDERGIDEGTGTLLLRAIFSNRQEDLPPSLPRLTPGSFVRVRLELGHLTDAILIPELAVARDQAGAYVMIVGSEGGKDVAQRRNIRLGPKYGSLIVIEPITAEVTADASGETNGGGSSNTLQPDDRIIIQGLQRTRDGAEVAPVEGQFEIPEEIQNYVHRKRES